MVTQTAEEGHLKLAGHAVGHAACVQHRLQSGQHRTRTVKAVGLLEGIGWRQVGCRGQLNLLPTCRWLLGPTGCSGWGWWCNRAVCPRLTGGGTALHRRHPRLCLHLHSLWPLNLRLLSNQDNRPGGCHCTHATAALAISSAGATRGRQAAAGICHIGDGSQQCSRGRTSRVCRAALLLGGATGGGPGASLLLLLLLVLLLLPLHGGYSCACLHLLLEMRLLAPPP